MGPRIICASSNLALSLFVIFAAGCSESDSADVSVDTTADTDVGPACGGCGAGKTCCPSRFDGDIPRCVDTTTNPENCGACGTFCDGACLDSGCVTAPTCTPPAGACPDRLTCSGQSGGQGRCCPDGTTFIQSPADFFGCCPDGDICGCREGNCPISRRDMKHDIHYLDAAELARLGRELLQTRLATYQYNGQPTERVQLGFIIDDGVPSHGIAGDRGHVDLYGYISLAVAALQTQQSEIEQLRKDLDALKARLDAMPR